MRDLTDHCVDHGISALYFPDHLIGGGNADSTTTTPWLALWPTLMDVAQRHPDVDIGTLVSSPSLRPAAQLCVEASTVAHIIGRDRFRLSIGAGGAQSDQIYVGEHLQPSELAERFHEYVSEVEAYRQSTHSPPLRLASDFHLRVASDSVSTIDVVNSFGDSWVTTGGWKKTLDERIERVKILYSHLSPDFSGSVAVTADVSDGITTTSSSGDVQQYASLYNIPIDEIIIPLSVKR